MGRSLRTPGVVDPQPLVSLTPSYGQPWERVPSQGRRMRRAVQEMFSANQIACRESVKLRAILHAQIGSSFHETATSGRKSRRWSSCQQGQERVPSAEDRGAQWQESREQTSFRNSASKENSHRPSEFSRTLLKQIGGSTGFSEPHARLLAVAVKLRGAPRLLEMTTCFYTKVFSLWPSGLCTSPRT